MKSIRSFALAAPVALASTGLALAMLAPSGCSRAPEAPSVSYTFLDGRTSDLASLRGHVVLVNFWSTRCAPCLADMPRFAQTWRKFSARGFDTLAVAMSYDPPIAVQSFAQSRALPFGVVTDMTGEVAASFGGVDVTPTTLLINKRGKIVARWIGETDFAELDKQIGLLLAE